MSKKGSSYENLYTQQIADALGEQPGYENRKSAEKAKIKEETQTFRRVLRMFGYLGVTVFLGVCGYLINLDPDNAGPCAIALAIFLGIGGLFWFMNK